MAVKYLKKGLKKRIRARPRALIFEKRFNWLILTQTHYFCELFHTKPRIKSPK